MYRKKNLRRLCSCLMMLFLMAGMIAPTTVEAEMLSLPNELTLQPLSAQTAPLALSESPQIANIADTFEVYDKADFEPLAGGTAGDPLNGFTSKTGVAQQSDAMNNTADGSNSMEIKGTTADSNKFEITKTYPAIVTGAKVSVDFYDDMESGRTIIMHVKGGSMTDVNTSETYIGILSNSYFYRGKGVGTQNIQASSSIQRTKGWHTFEIDYTTKGQVTFRVDNQEMGVIKNAKNQDQLPDFKTVSFANYWSDNKGIAPAYVDNYSVLVKKPVPASLQGDDTENTLSWEYYSGYENASAYEITTDGGNTYTVCDSNPVYLGNRNIDAGKVGIRVKYPSEEAVYDTVWYEGAFTFNAESKKFFENQVDIAQLAKVADTGLELSTEYSRSGISSMKITSQSNKVSNNCYQFEVRQAFPDIVQNKVVSIWFYDTMDTMNGFLVATGIQSDKNIGKVGIGISNSTESNKGMTNYYVRAFGEKIQKCVDAIRSEGWHNFQWDFRQEGKCIVSIDQQQVFTCDSTGFDTISFIDYWSAARHSIYLDDLEITADGIITDIPAAPTEPVTNDTDKTFGFTYVDQKEEIGLYEYSTDGGQNFSDCTANPQQIANTGFDAGQVMVRLKAQDGTMAGQVLRNKIAFTKPYDAYLDQLQSLYDKGCSISQAMYNSTGWAEFTQAIADAKTALDNKEGYTTAYENLSAAMEQLVLKPDDEVSFDFENRSADPFQIIYGTQDWGEYTNTSARGAQALKLDTVSVDGTHIAQVKFGLVKAMEDAYVSFCFRDTKAGGTYVKLMDSETNNGILFYGSDKYYYKLITDGVEGAAVCTEMRRNGDWYELQLNLAADDGIHCFMDSRNWLNTNLISKFDSIEITYKDASAGFLTIDDFTIMQKNPIKSFVPETDTITLGYYDTYEVNINHVAQNTEKDYKTTDLITYTSSNPSVAQVTTEGSVEYVGEGQAIITATASSGASAQFTVTCKDIKAEGIKISDSDYNDEPHFITELSLNSDQKKVVNAILSPEGVTLRKVTWSSDHEDIVSVNNGELTALKEGTAVITAVSEDKTQRVSINVTVAKPADTAAVKLYVAKDGNDYTGDGSMESPFASIERARDEIRAMGGYISTGVDVILREGTYTILKGIEFDEQDQGNNSAPITYRAFDGENVKLAGTIDIETKDMKVVTDEETLKKLPESARGNVYEYDLSSLISKHKDLQYMGHSIGNLPWLKADGKNVSNPYYSLSFDQSAMVLSRWPNVGQTVYSSSYKGYTRINKVVHAGANPRNWKDDIIGKSSWVAPEDRDKYDTFEIMSDALTTRMKSWYGITMDGSNILAQDLWMSGYWYNDFSDQTAQIRSITEDGVIKSDVPSGYSARSTNAYNRFYVYNLIQELDIPGEWYFDQNNYKLYVYPPEGTDMNDNHLIQMAALEDTMLSFDQTSDITFNGIDIQGVLGHAVEIEGSKSIKIEDADIMTTELSVAKISDSSTGQYSSLCGFENCNIADVNGGISISGGDMDNLISQGNYITNCHFENFATINKSYNPAISLGGVGNRVSSCKIEDGPHNAIMYSGNDNLIEFTEITDVVKEAKDQSAIYTGRNVLARGSVIRNCYFHDIPKGTGNPNSAIYLDDLNAGAEIIDNTFENMGWGVFVNGGRDNIIVDNDFISCGDGVIINDWGYTGVNNWYLHGYGTYKNPSSMSLITIDWKNRDGAYGKYEHLWCILEDNPWHSKYNKIIGNTYDAKTTRLIYYMSRAVQKDYAEVLEDWYFIKDNVLE